MTMDSLKIVIFFLVIFLHTCWIKSVPADYETNKPRARPKEIWRALDVSYSLDDSRHRDASIFSGHSITDSSWLCRICKLVAALVEEYVGLKKTDDEIASLVTKICIDLKIEDKRVCTGIVQEFKGEVLGVLDKGVLTPSDICGTYIGESCAHVEKAYGPWNVTLPSTAKPPLKPILPPKV